MAPFQYEQYRNPWLGSIADLMAHGNDAQARAAEIAGQAQARAAEQRGAAWGNAIGNIGQMIGAMPQQIAQQKRIGLQDELLTGQVSEQKRAIAMRSALSKAITDTPMADEGGISVYDIPSITKNLPPEFRANADEVVKHLGGINEAFRQEQAAKLTVIQRGATSLLAAGADPDLTLHFIDTLEKNGYPKGTLDTYRQVIQQHPDKTEMVLRQFVPAQKPEVLKPGEQGFDPITRAPIPGMTIPEEPDKGAYTINGQRFDRTGKPIGAIVPTQTPPKSYQKSSVLLDGKPAEVLTDPTPGGHVYDLNGQPIDNAAARVKPIPPASLTIHNLQDAQNAPNRTSLAQGLNDGTVPPSMLSKRSSDYNATLAEANQIHVKATGKPLDFRQLELDYKGAQRFVASLNGPNMVRFQALGKSVVNTIDEVRALAEELKQGGIQKWNSATRGTIQQLWGNSPQSDLAARYVAAVNTLKEEYASLAQGGFSPTEPAWKLANEQINGNYGVKDLNASLLESQRLINFRLQGFTNLTPLSIGGQTPPPAATGGGMIEATDPQGNIHHAPAGTPLPAGWTVVKR